MLKAIRSIFKKAENVEGRTVVDADGFSATVVQNSRFDKFGPAERYSICLKISIDGKEYLVKKRLYAPEETGGYQEFMSTMDAKKVEELFPFVQIIPARLGYTDIEGESFFISDWKDLPKYHEYVWSPQNALVQQEIDNQFSELEQYFLDENNIDLNRGNAFYDPVNKKIVLFDLLNVRRKREFLDHE